MSKNNAAGRLLKIMKRIEEQINKDSKAHEAKDKKTVLAVWIEVLGIVNNQDDLYGRLAETQKLADEVEAYANEIEPSTRWSNLTSLKTLFRPSYLSHPIASMSLEGIS